MSVLRAEIIKSRRSALWGLSFVMPFIAVVLPAALYLSSKKVAAGNHPDMVIQGAFMVWLRLFLPLFSVMVALQLFMSEHTLGMWKHLNAMPTRGRPQIGAKYLVAFIALAAAIGFLVVDIVIALGVLKLQRPSLVVTPEPQAWPAIGCGLGLSVIAGIGILPAMLFCAGRLRRGTIGGTLGAGAAACVLGTSILPRDVPFASYFPWCAGGLYSEVLDKGVAEAHWLPLTVGSAAVLMTAIGAHLFMERRRPHF